MTATACDAEQKQACRRCWNDGGFAALYLVLSLALALGSFAAGMAVGLAAR